MKCKRTICVCILTFIIAGFVLLHPAYEEGAIHLQKETKDKDMGVITFLRCSPKGKEIAFTAYQGKNCSLYVVVFPGGKIRKVKEGVAPTIAWSNGGGGIVYTRSDWKGIYYYDIKSGCSKLMLENGKDLKFSPKGSWYSYVPRGAKLEDSRGLVVVNKTSGKHKRLFEKMIVLGYNWSPSEEYIAAIGITLENNSPMDFFSWRSVVVANVLTKKESFNDARTVCTVSAPPVFLTSNKVLYPFTEVVGGSVPLPPPEEPVVKSIWGIRSYDIVSHQQKTLLRKACRSVIAPLGLTLSPDRKKIAIVLPEGIHCRALIYDIGRNKIVREILTDYATSPIDWLPSSSGVVYIKDNHLWYLSIITGEVKPLL
ncbi:MAG: TolB family protein [bacterium]